jgi:hypothetical protein
MDEQKERTENKDKRYTVEWSFSFEKLGEQVNEFVKEIGAKGNEEIKHGQFSEPLGDATSARVRIDFSVGEATIKALEGNDQLIDADLTYVGDVTLKATGETEKVVHLSQAAGAAEWFRGAFGWVGSGQRLRWDIGLTPHIPLNLDLHSGAGRSNFDLSALQLTGLNIASGAGELTLNLPGGKYATRVSGGVGRTAVTVPPNADLELNLSSGAGEVHLDVNEGAALKARISGGVGETNIRIPVGAAVRLEAKTGIGSIQTGPALRRVRGGSDFMSSGGVWETDGFETAERQIIIRFDGGVGALNVR